MTMTTYRKFTENKLLIASNNKDKVQEFTQLLSFYHNLEIVSVDQYNIESPEETGSTFKENANLKAIYYSQLTGLPALADDSGIVIDNLKGEPGVYSADWAGEERNFDLAMDKVESELKKLGFTSSKASYVCSLSLRWPDGHIENVEDYINGTISFPRRGSYYFGYDPIFVPEGYNQTFAELGPVIKNKISHRSKALTKLINLCFQ